MGSHIMLDLETVDTRPTAAILSIGAVYFDENGAMHRRYYQAVDVDSCTALGLTSSPSTLEWWGRQNEAARQVFTDPSKVYLIPALFAFAEFVEPGAKVWGNGAAFDNAILANAYAAAGLALPWKFYNDRCYRTVSAFNPVERVQKGTHHNALDDAISQADHLAGYLGDSLRSDLC